ncbi:hypothetical protein JOD02_002178 [Caldicoprobacter guelmensis]|nr:hypothetical protein [Caldicoprobacter guelmensis]
MIEGHFIVVYFLVLKDLFLQIFKHALLYNKGKRKGNGDVPWGRVQVCGCTVAG